MDEIDKLQTALRNARNDLRDCARALTSIEADFEQDTWTFQLHGQPVSSGDFFVINQKDWDRVWERHIYEEISPVSASPESMK